MDHNKIVETSIAYFLICTGAVAPKPTTAIMRQGESEYVVSGESLVRIDAKTSFGGTYAAEKDLDAQPEFKSFLIAVWKKAAGVK